MPQVYYPLYMFFSLLLFILRFVLFAFSMTQLLLVNKDLYTASETQCITNARAITKQKQAHEAHLYHSKPR